MGSQLVCPGDKHDLAEFVLDQNHRTIQLTYQGVPFPDETETA
jgi:hypothetical protein